MFVIAPFSVDRVAEWNVASHNRLNGPHVIHGREQWSSPACQVEYGNTLMKRLREFEHRLIIAAVR